LSLAGLASWGQAAAQTPRTCIQQSVSAVPALYAEAQQAFRQQRYAAAYGRFMRLADSGHVGAAEVALLMYSQGSALFGQHWYASASQQACWRALVINHSRNVPWQLESGRFPATESE
jgi:hypothetical protein